NPEGPGPITCVNDTASAVCLAPLHYRRRTTRPVSYYALFQGWLLLSQPPGCLSDSTSFPPEHTLRCSSWCSALFPSRRPSLAPDGSLPSAHPPVLPVWLAWGSR